MTYLTMVIVSLAIRHATLNFNITHMKFTTACSAMAARALEL